MQRSLNVPTNLATPKRYFDGLRRAKTPLERALAQMPKLAMTCHCKGHDVRLRQTPERFLKR